jgi:hypothetical protein
MMQTAIGAHRFRLPEGAARAACGLIVSRYWRTNVTTNSA